MPTAYLSPSQLRDLTDVSVNPGSGQNNYPLTWIWNSTTQTGQWQASNNIAGVTIRAGAGGGSQAIGSTANSSGNFWIAQGFQSGVSNTTGEGWIAQGVNAGASNTTGNFWIAQGYDAGYYDTRSDVLNIANSRSKSLICGNFANDCIYFGHVGPITSSANVPIPTAAVHAAASNTTRASLRIDSGVAPTTPNTGDIWVNSSNNSLNFQIPLVNLQGTQVLATRRTGWAAPTGTATRTSFDTATATTTQLAERLKALIDDLTTHGLIGT